MFFKLVLKEMKNHPINLIYNISTGAMFGYAVDIYFEVKKKVRCTDDIQKDEQLSLFEQTGIAYRDGYQIEKEIYEQLAVKYQNIPINVPPSDPRGVTEPIVVEPDEGLVNVFKNDDDDWSWPEELASREDATYYVIHQDEYAQNELDYDQKTMQYYKEDNILIDEEEIPVYNFNNITGPLLFGHGSNNKSVVYIRNVELEIEWEILLDEGSYQKSILGVEWDDEWQPEIKPDKSWSDDE